MRQSLLGIKKEIAMKIPCKSIFLTLLLLAGLTTAYAEPGHGRGGQQDQGQQDQGQQVYEAERNGERAAQPNEREPNRDNVHAPSRNNGRMTQEERSALRRQINEAGQDIYSGKYKR